LYADVGYEALVEFAERLGKSCADTIINVCANRKYIAKVTELVHRFQNSFAALISRAEYTCPCLLDGCSMTFVLFKLIVSPNL